MIKGMNVRGSLASRLNRTGVLVRPVSRHSSDDDYVGMRKPRFRLTQEELLEEEYLRINKNGGLIRSIIDGVRQRKLSA
jgi:hypothetical protein